MQENLFRIYFEKIYIYTQLNWKKNENISFHLNKMAKTKQQLLDEISSLVDEYISNALKHEHSIKEEESVVVPPNNTCVAILTNGKQCTRERSEKGPDNEVCKFHNNPKFIGRLQKISTPTISVTREVTSSVDKSPIEKKDVEKETPKEIVEIVENVEAASEKTDSNCNNELETKIEEDSVEDIFVRKDEDGDLVDQHGNIWDAEDQKVIGKKDLETKQKVYYETND